LKRVLNKAIKSWCSRHHQLRNRSR